MPKSADDSSGRALAIAISALAGIALFWAVVFAFVVAHEGHQLVARAQVPVGLKITDVTGGITALCALFVAAFSLWTSRRHNRLSVRPLAWISLGDYEDELFVKIQNNGIGPMIIERVVVRRGLEEKNSVIEWMPRRISWTTFVMVFEERSIARDKEIIALQLNGESQDQAFAAMRDQCRRALCNLVVEVHYRDAYDRRMPPAVRDLTWFKRNL